MQKIQKGTILDNIYEIQEEIGSGGGGIVFKAKHLRLDKDVVVKKIRDEALGKLESRQEVDILKNLNHPYLPRVFDFIESNEAVYTVMDFIPGENLSDILKRKGKFSQEQVKKWAKQLGEALAYLHEQNPPIIHSDIKPANIMLTPEGDICLIDFNVSLAVGKNMESAVGVSAGFSPPEQYRSLEMYARITQNDTCRKYLSMVNQNPKKGVYAEKKSEVLNDDATEILTEETGQTEILDGNADVTVILDESNNAKEILEKEADITEILNENTDVTEILEEDAASILKEDDVTEILDEDNGVTGSLDKNCAIRNQKEISNGQLGESLGIVNAASEEMTRKNTEYIKYIGKGIDKRADIYSLGATLYVLLTGKKIPADFAEQNIEKELSSYVSEGFLHILVKMLRIDPDKRYQEGKEYLKALHNCKKLDKRYITLNRKKRSLQICSVILALVGIFLIAFGLQKDKSEQNNAYLAILQQAEDAIANKDFAQAFSYISEAKAFEQERIEAYEKEIYALYSMGAYADCIQKGKEYINAPAFYIELEADKVSMGNIYYITGNACYETGDYDFARTLFESAIGQNKNNALYYRDYAICLAKAGRSEEAKLQLDTGMELGLQQDSLYMVKGEIAFGEKKSEEAIQNFMECIEITADSSLRMRAALSCVNVYRQEGNEQLDAEIELLESYMEKYSESNNLVVMEYLAQSYARKASLEQENAGAYYQKALELFQKIYESGYVTYQIQENIAVLYENMGNLEQAEELFLQMAEDYPGRYEVYKRLAYLEADKQQKKENVNRDYHKMKQYYEQAVSLYSEDIQDMEMQMLNNMMNELKAGGWF